MLFSTEIRGMFLIFEGTRFQGGQGVYNLSDKHKSLGPWLLSFHSTPWILYPSTHVFHPFTRTLEPMAHRTLSFSPFPF